MMIRLQAITAMAAVVMATVVYAILPPTNPPWPPTYNITESLITMQCNSSGTSSPSRASQFGIVSYDWSNAKAVWAKQKPINCEEMLEQQALMAKQAGTKHVFVYRNVVKALPWFTKVRTKLNDPAYDGFFLKFDPTKQSEDYHVPQCALENSTHCSPYYHDQEQTPEVPSPDEPNPDGKCDKDYCDCGIHPCGEYLFDHRNGTMLREFLVNEVVLGALIQDDAGRKVVDGLFIDDYWCSDLLCGEDPTVAGCSCDDPVQGPTEIDPYSQLDMGLSDQDILDITLEWNITMTAIQKALLANQAYTWSLIYGQENANAKPVLLSQETCHQQLIEACGASTRATSIWQQAPMLFGFTVSNRTQLSQLQQDLAFYLLVRGDYTYTGYGE